MALVESDQLSIFWANIPAFLAAFLLSYLGNLWWTFGVSGHHRKRVSRFLSIAVMAFGLNQMIVYVVADRLGLDYRLALAVVVLAVPPIVFLASRRFAFTDHNQPPPLRPTP